ncbi:MAG: cupin domain-containing protein [Bacteroidota bacterium]|nr:cupin domain-containing protein [Bacteroidota bacterium]MDX5430980.1 cupin domain-containing protein [Bacteroidota bacterium]MDX5469731.1 cupin domain-containing protein [Bacteroidota bacterium]
MKIKVQSIAASFKEVNAYWKPAILAQLNGQDVRIARLKGEFPWHQHDHEDELFFVIEGNLLIDLKEESLRLGPGEMVVIPRGTQHRPRCKEEVKVLLFEPSETLNTGNTASEFTQKVLKDLR